MARTTTPFIQKGLAWKMEDTVLLPMSDMEHIVAVFILTLRFVNVDC